MTDTRPHFWFQIIEEIDANYEVLCAENLKNDVLYYYGFEENETHSLIDFDFTEYDDFYIAPHSVEYFVYDTPCFVVEENGYGEIMSIMEATGEYTLESISNAAPDYPYRVSNIFNYADGEGYIGEYTPSTVSWNINNKTVQSLHIGNKEIQTIERVSDGAIIYQKEEENYDLIITFTGSQFTPYNNSNNVGLTGSNMVINWGDGTTESLTSNIKLPTHTYQTSDTYTIQIQGEITGIGAYCFYGCTGLTDIIIPSTVTSLGSNCFRNCTDLTNITIPSSVTSLESHCFRSCGLTNITIPSSVTSIGAYCFYGCTFLTNITIPSSVTSLGSSCFRTCTSLINYQLYWQTPPVVWNGILMPNNPNTHFTIPNGTTANYVTKSFPSEKLIERSA